MVFSEEDGSFALFFKLFDDDEVFVAGRPPPCRSRVLLHKRQNVLDRNFFFFSLIAHILRTFGIFFNDVFYSRYMKVLSPKFEKKKTVELKDNILSNIFSL